MSRTCLVVDDSRVVRKVARRILEAHGYADCVLLDWNMPVMDGITFLRNLRREFGPDNPMVVFCTTENDMDHIEQAISSGAQEYIMKPFDEEILIGKFGQVGLL